VLAYAFSDIATVRIYRNNDNRLRYPLVMNASREGERYGYH